MAHASYVISVLIRKRSASKIYLSGASQHRAILQTACALRFYLKTARLLCNVIGLMKSTFRALTKYISYCNKMEFFTDGFHKRIHATYHTRTGERIASTYI